MLRKTYVQWCPLLDSHMCGWDVLTLKKKELNYKLKLISGINTIRTSDNHY